ncbi:hypothetical protein BSKO_00875 [Bryopsis sp. KO-2023]|nr:hypothetical protein BSKO_00875 [Bryopsis sp. KO-2023]
MEKHFKSEQEARKQAEEELEQALQTEMMAKKQLDDTIQKHSDEAHELEEERESTRMERKALEAMRQEFENELQAARAEVAKAQDALKTAEDRGLVLHGAIGAAQMYTGQAQTRLLASMQNSYYNAIQAGLPWGGTLTQHGHLPALPPPEVPPLGPPAMHTTTAAPQRKGAKPMGKGARQDGKFGKTGKNPGALPPLGQGGLYGTGNSLPGYAQPLGSQAKGHQAKTKQKAGQQRSKERFGGQRF